MGTLTSVLVISHVPGQTALCNQMLKSLSRELNIIRRTKQDMGFHSPSVYCVLRHELEMERSRHDSQDTEDTVVFTLLYFTFWCETRSYLSTASAYTHQAAVHGVTESQTQLK